MRRLIAGIIVLLSLSLAAWANWPPAQASDTLVLSRPMLLLPGSGPSGPSLSDEYLLTTTWPPHVPAAREATVRLEFTLNPSAASSVNPDIYITHRILAEARLEINQLHPSPGAQLSQPLLPGQALSFTWRLAPQNTGEAGIKHEGRVWFYLNFIPHDPSAENVRLPLAVQTIFIRHTALLGVLSGPAANWLALIGLISSAILLLSAHLHPWRQPAAAPVP